ncbi:hypothetical protein NLJ89_g2028 [Agrocybe chaxingu]|uniref:DUF1365-domain-containing protein n=1 Tax=Agrocybe chaxingu TaxID=84603 RepID=A0A9W8K843_9AGAR|nr:hypothetical protein NLJ89_g2028 [Agrocybe chaxingu]
MPKIYQHPGCRVPIRHVPADPVMSSQLVVDVCVTVLCVSLSAFFHAKNPAGRPQDSTAGPLSRAYILRNQVTHARLLPVESANAFTYSTLCLLMSLNALEGRRLDLGGGWIFGYGGNWGSIVGLRSKPYLTTQPGTIRNKLETLLEERGFSNVFHDAWMMTMPAFMGFEGINPLTAYFCYDEKEEFRLVVLEIHNTFGESHVHVLQVGTNEDEIPATGFDHQWTFSREFHVSPFNDRSGFYEVSVKNPTHPPTSTHFVSIPAPRPAVRVHLYTAGKDDTKGQLKLTALLRPTSATPLTTSSLLVALIQTPFSLLLTLPRILYVAWVLHYTKKLDVFLRPPPKPATKDWDTEVPDTSSPSPAGGVKWLEEGMLERFARRRVEGFLRRRVNETGIEVTLIAADPSIPQRTFSPSAPLCSRLTIYYLSFQFFTILFLAPSAKHALLLGSNSEDIFHVSSRSLFLSVFSTMAKISLPSSPSSPRLSPKSRPSYPAWLQRIRCQNLPRTLASSIPTSHFLDSETLWDRMICATVIYTHRYLDALEKWVFTLARARLVEGQEPWLQWERAAELAMSVGGPANWSRSLSSVERKGPAGMWAEIGSVRRES